MARPIAPTRLATPEGRAVMDALARAREGAWSRLVAERDPIQGLLDDAITRATALERKSEPITPAEKLKAFRLMGFEPTPKQLSIVRDEHPIRTVRAGRRSGKTTLAAHEALAVMLMKPGSHGWIVAPDYELAFRCWEIMVEELDRLAARGVIRYKVKQNTQTSMRIVLDNGSWAEGKSSENADDLQGVGLDWLIIDEIAQILPFVFLEFLMPALSDRNGWSFLIGTPIGESWVEKEVRHQTRKAQLAGLECDWSEHLFETWHNTKAFPGGRTDPKILRMERTMPFEEWMEQVCAQPQKSRYVTYKEFHEDVHVRSCPYNPELPVQLAIDPSTGVNPYAVAAFQDYGEAVFMIDEYYRLAVLAADVIDDLAGRPWWKGVDQAIMDDAWPQERETWRRHKKVRFSLRRAGKSHSIVDSLPVVRDWLRDPLVYNARTLPVRDALVAENFPDKTWPELDIEDQRVVMARTDERVSADMRLLLECARLFVDRRCVNAVDEFSGYIYRKPKRDDRNPSETPTDHKNHLMDCVRYYLYDRKRHHGARRARPERYVELA